MCASGREREGGYIQTISGGSSSRFWGVGAMVRARTAKEHTWVAALVRHA